MNKAILIGRVGADPEVEYLPGQVCKATFSVATTKYFNKGGERQERTTWHRCVAWRKIGEVIEQHLKKGMLVAIEGEIDNTSREVDGVKKTYSNVVVGQIEFLSQAQEGHI